MKLHLISIFIMLNKIVCTIILILILLFSFHSCSDTVTDTDDDLDNNNPNNPTNSFNSQAPPGDSAASFLQNTQFTELLLEIDYMPGHEPTKDGLDSLKAFLNKRLNKSNIVISEPTEVSSGGQSVYSANDVRELEEQHRDNFTEGDGSTLEVYFLIVDGEFDQSNVLGIAYWNTSMAFFGQTIAEVSSGIGAPPRDKIETTVFNHEFGHNMGLVGNGSPHPEGQEPHETGSDQGQHCTVDGCLMEPAVQTSDFFANLFDGTIRDLDPLCVEDLQANGGK